MPELPNETNPPDVADIQRKADDFARRQYADVFKQFEQIFKPKSEETEQNDVSGGSSERD